MPVRTIIFAMLGDTIETSVRHPFPRVIRMRLDTPESCAYANSLLCDPKSGWHLVGSNHKE